MAEKGKYQSIEELIAAQRHFGQATRYWNPKMQPFIFGARNKIHIINLEKTLPATRAAANEIRAIAETGGEILFVGTKRAAKEPISRQATRVNMPYVNYRWLGGMLSKFKTIRQAIHRLNNLVEMSEDGSLDSMTDKDATSLRREREKLERTLGGIRTMKALPAALFVVDVEHDRIAVSEANKLGIPVFGLVDLAADPEGVDYIIPGNNDAIRTIELYTALVGDAILDGRRSYLDSIDSGSGKMYSEDAADERDLSDDEAAFLELASSHLLQLALENTEATRSSIVEMKKAKEWAQSAQLFK